MYVLVQCSRGHHGILSAVISNGKSSYAYTCKWIILRNVTQKGASEIMLGCKKHMCVVVAVLIFNALGITS